jgi:hypothetical protein
MTIGQLRPFFGYYGGKWATAVKHYPKPDHPTIVEPFAGSAGYSLRYHDRKIVLYDADCIISEVWRYLIRVRPSEILSIPDIAPGGSVDDLRYPQEVKWLVGFWLNRGVSSPRKKPSKWMREGIRPGSFWGDRVRQTIAAQVESIRHWRVYGGPYKNASDEGPATWFVDPPYQVEGSHYRYGSSRIDYQFLGLWCKAREGQVIVCENVGASWLPFRHLAATKTTGPGRTSEEAIWLSSDQTI